MPLDISQPVSAYPASNIRLDCELAHRVLGEIAPRHKLTSVRNAKSAFTNAVHILEAKSPGGPTDRFVVKRLTDDPDPERAVAENHGLQIARRHGIPAPEPVLLDATGDLLGIPGIITTFVEGRQIASPEDPRKWAEELARLLLRVHDVRPEAGERRLIYDGRDMGLYFLRGSWPKVKAGHPLTGSLFGVVQELQPEIQAAPPALLHMDYWPGNVLWLDGRVSALLDWDSAAYGDPALDVGYFRMNMYLRGIREAADPFLEYYEAESGPVRNLGFWEVACAVRPLPDPAMWIPASREMGDHSATDDRADTDFYEFASNAIRRAREGR